MRRSAAYKMRVVIISLFFVSFLIYSFEAKKINIDKNKVTSIEYPLVKHKSLRHKLLGMGFKPEVIESMFLKKKLKPKPKPDVINDTIPLFKHIDSEIYAKIYLGHPGQEFKVILDTAWADSFIPGDRCVPERSKACGKPGLKPYNAEKSSTATFYYNETFQINFNSQSKVSGFLCQDLLHLGHINVTNVTFGAASEVPDEFALLVADGIFGMAFQSLSHMNMTPFFYNIMSQFKNMPHKFSFYFNRDETTTKGGSLIIGEANDKHGAKFEYFPVVEPKYWTIHMEKAYINKPQLTLCANGCNATFDTGTTVFELPKVDFKNFVDRIKAYPVAGTNRYEVQCETVLKLPKISFQFSRGITFSLKGKEYVQNIDIGPRKYCLIAFTSHNEDSWVFGVSFLYQYFTEYDMDKKQIGIAPANL